MTREEFSRHVVTNYDLLFRFVRSRGLSAADAEDVLQQSLLKLLLACDVIDADRPGGFFFTVLKHAVVDYWRKRGRQPPFVALPDQLPAPDLPDAVVGDDAPPDRLRALLAGAVAGLTPRERRAFAAYWRQRGDRGPALRALGLGRATPKEKYKIYDGPLHHARRKVALVLLPNGAVLADAGTVPLWGLLDDILNGASPDADLET
jgi:hypothetical protein